MELKPISIDTSKYNKIYLTGDLHGRVKYLNKYLENIKFNKDRDLLICVGDLIDRGDYNLETLDLVNESWFLSCIGNHELLAWYGINHNSLDEALDDERYHLWLFNGGGWFHNELKKYDERIQDEIYCNISTTIRNNILKMYAEINFTIDDVKVKISHASRFNKKSVELPIPLSKYEVKNLIMPKHTNPFWCRDYSQYKEQLPNVMYVHGHTPQTTTPVFIKSANVVLIDSGVGHKPENLKLHEITNLIKQYKEIYNDSNKSL